MAKINLWRVNFTDRRARFMNLWTNVRRDFPPEIYVTLEFFPYISRKPQDLPGTSHTRRESWSFPFHTNNAWNAFSTISWKSQDFPETSHKRENEVFFLKIRDVGMLFTILIISIDHSCFCRLGSSYGKVNFEQNWLFMIMCYDSNVWSQISWAKI